MKKKEQKTEVVKMTLKERILKVMLGDLVEFSDSELFDILANIGIELKKRVVK